MIKTRPTLFQKASVQMFMNIFAFYTQTKSSREQNKLTSQNQKFNVSFSHNESWAQNVTLTFKVKVIVQYQKLLFVGR